ncbi:MAG: hypothetical protein E7010_05780 [Alphaproteobacteria bacterium]|nr:hypothetical protein [Alphaproteobacteria bacterium]
MRTNMFKTIVALMAAAIAVLVSSCSKDEGLFSFGLDGEGTDPSISYVLDDTRHIEIENCGLVGDSIHIVCGHRAYFTGTNTEDVTKDYKVTNPAKLGSTETYVENIGDIAGQTFNWSNGQIAIGKSVITLAFGKTYTTNVLLNGKTYTMNNGLGYCTVKAARLVVGTDVKEIETEKFTVDAKIIFTLSCEEEDECEYPLILNVTETHKEVLTYTYDEAIVISSTQAKVVRHDLVDGVEKGTLDILVDISATLQAEAKKTTADLTAIAFNSIAATATKGTYRASWNVVAHELYASYPETVSFVDNGESHTVALKGNWNVKFDSKETIDNSDDVNFVYNTTANYKLVCDNYDMATATQEIEQKDAKNTQKISVSIVGEDENGVKIRFFIDNSKDADVEKFFYAPSGLSVKTEAEKRIETSPISLTQTGHNAGNWNKGTSGNTSDNVKYTSYSRVDSYVYNNGKVSSQVTYTKNDNYIVVWEGKEYVAEGMGDVVITAGTPSETADNSNNSIISKSYSVNHSIARGNVSDNADQLFTLYKNRTPNTIPGYVVKAAAMTDIYNANRTAPARTVICALFEEINGSNTLYVEFNSKGEEISRHANVTVSNDGIMSMTWNGADFVPGKLTGVNTTTEKPQEWLYTSYADGNVQGYVSPMSVTKHTLQNPYKESGVKTTVDGEEIITINGVTLK